MKRHEALALVVILLAFVIHAPIISVVAASNSVTVSVHPTAVLLGQNFTVSGSVTSASSGVTGTSVLIKVLEHNGTVITSSSASVVGTGAAGTYSRNFTTAGPYPWGAGTYNVSATYGTGSATVSNSTTFNVVVITCCISPTTVTSTTAPTESTMYGQPVVSQGFVSQYNGPIGVFMWVSVQNPTGQTVGVFIGSATLMPSVPATISAILFNVPHGTYTAAVFVTTVSGIVVTSTSTTSAFNI